MGALSNLFGWPQVLPGIWAITFIAGCSSMPPQGYYSSPPAPAGWAIVHGQAGPKTWLGTPSYTVFPTAIDGYPIEKATEHRQLRVPITPGLHAVNILFVGGGGLATAALPLEARAGVTYLTRAEYAQGRATLWIEEQTGAPASPQVTTYIFNDQPTYIYVAPIRIR